MDSLPEQHSEDKQNVMMRMKYLVVAATLSLALAGCSSDTIPDNPPSEMYATAQEKLQSGNFSAAITQLEALDNRYPFGPYSQQVQLDLIYAYYKADDLPLAQATIERFARLNPTHPNIDYVLYMRGVTDMAFDDNTLQSFFGIDRSDRDPQHARNAFRDFTQLVQNYPQSAYAADAQKRLIFLHNRLADYELSVAQYYTKRGAYVAVVNRVEQMLRDFPNSEATREALPLMENAYRQLNLPAQADKVKRIIETNNIKNLSSVNHNISITTSCVVIDICRYFYLSSLSSDSTPRYTANPYLLCLENSLILLTPRSAAKNKTNNSEKLNGQAHPIKIFRPIARRSNIRQFSH